ncbi:YppE family protein [Salisediminibacterium selenitireducens]|uniref:DUF1798 domain-containing protein n=1 Tax=Bacillus selenitireducens (strain ATCC 700615 / DSM 15326 / MLS10) TaxID=439292 RepID=D6XUV8_BACIE|nr:YppE family protein [Salisediminibacterium selenitireducens]ADH99594.1 hypothetical protein Bsel_2090 [[Bacillus] selenitireducens MLS10]
MNTDKLIQQTKELRALNQEAESHFYHFAEEGREASFFDEVKPFADRVSHALSEWQSDLNEWMKTYNPSYLHWSQVEQMIEHFEVVSVKAFSEDTRKKQFIEQIKSIEYTLSVIAGELEKGEK